MSIRRSDDSSYSGSRKRGHSRNGSRVQSEVDQIDGACAKNNRKKESRSEVTDVISVKSLKGESNEAQLHLNTATIICEKLTQEDESFERATWVGVGHHKEMTVGQVPKAVGQVKQHLGIDIAGHEAGLGDAAIKAEHLEIELRQRALANLRKHRNTICEVDEHNQNTDSIVLMKDGKKGEVLLEEVTVRQNLLSNLKEGKKLAAFADRASHLLPVGDTQGGHAIDTDEDRWPLASDISPEAHKNIVEQSISRSLMPAKPHAFGEPPIETQSTLDKKGISEGTTVQLTSISQLKVSQLPLENEIQPEIENNTSIVESSKNSDLHPYAVVSGEASTVVMAYGNSEPDKSGDLQVEAKESFDTRDWNVVQRLESMNFIYDELDSKVEQEIKGISGIGECLDAGESAINAGFSLSQNHLETNNGNVLEASTAISVDPESHSEKMPISLPKDSERVSSPCGPQPEIAVGKQEDVASMFQQKTMSVMRGGELVQVNYKVYIPKRAAELAKRRLQR